MAQDSAESDLSTQIKEIELFLNHDFSDYDKKFQTYITNVPKTTQKSFINDISNEEILGWAHLSNQNYVASSKHFNNCWEFALKEDLIELGALYGWQLAKSYYLQSLLGEPGALEKSLKTFDESIKRGGLSPWFNRMRASLNRARRSVIEEKETQDDFYISHLLQSFDDTLEKLGESNVKFDRWCNRIDECLHSEKHDEYKEGIFKLGQILGYSCFTPQYDSSTDCIWRAIFGNSKEIFTFELKIEQCASQSVSSHDIGQAHNQNSRAIKEYGPRGFNIRSSIVTHLTNITDDAEESAGIIKIIQKSAIIDLWIKINQFYLYIEMVGLCMIYQDEN